VNKKNANAGVKMVIRDAIESAPPAQQNYGNEF
jgi:hypothetical protein